MNDKFETLGQIIDSIESLVYSLNLPLPPQMHVEQMRVALPEKVEELKSVFVEITGENPWTNES